MGYNTENTEWPTSTPVSDATKSRIDTLFSLLDSRDQSVGDRLADELFTEDGVMHGGAGTAHGTEALRHSRDKAWTIIQSRRHTVQRVYVHDAEAKDLLIIGTVAMGFPNGKELASEFTARILFAGDKIKNYNVWADTAPMGKAIQEAIAEKK